MLNILYIKIIHVKGYILYKDYIYLYICYGLYERNFQESDQTVKNLPAMRETWVLPCVLKIPWGREWQPIPVFLPGEFHG